MSFTSLPAEVIVLIIKQLDIKSILNLYNTCHYFRNIVCMHGVIKECQLSLNTLATAQSLKLNFIKDISGHLQELNMSGVHDLCKSSLLPALKRLKSLKTLNIAYTKINVSEFVEMHPDCPTIKNIAINFHFHKPSVGTSLEVNHMLQCQSTFQSFENVHFVGSFMNLLSYNLSRFVLELATLNTLTYTIAEHATTCYRCKLKYDIDFKEFNIYILNWKESEMLLGNVYKLIGIYDYEYVIIHVILQNTYDVYCSEAFKQFFRNCGINARSDAYTLQFFDGNAVVMIWNQTTEFDDLFFSYFLKRVQEYFPCNYVPSRDKEEHFFKNGNDYYSILASGDDVENLNPRLGLEFKRRRLGAQNFTVHYDELMNEKREVQLKLHYCNFNRPITLSPSSNYLKKLTLLTISGPVRYSAEFFNILFRHCDNLVTLNIESCGMSPCALFISRFIHFSNSLKNLRIVDKVIVTETLFSALSNCKTLENVYVQDIHNEFTDLADPSAIFINCVNMYYFCMYASMNEAAKTRNSRILKNAKRASGKRHLYVELMVHKSSTLYNYDPYIDVFKLSSIDGKPVGFGKGK